MTNKKQGYREYWIEFPEGYPSNSDKLATVDDIPLGDGIHVIEHAALEAAEARIKEFEEALGKVKSLLMFEPSKERKIDKWDVYERCLNITRQALKGGKSDE